MCRLSDALIELGCLKLKVKKTRRHITEVLNCMFYSTHTHTDTHTDIHTHTHTLITFFVFFLHVQVVRLNSNLNSKRP